MYDAKKIMKISTTKKILLLFVWFSTVYISVGFDNGVDSIRLILLLGLSFLSMQGIVSFGYRFNQQD